MTWIDICNAALLLTGGQQINNLDEPTQEARGCKIFLEQTRTSILASHPWNCATNWAVPALVGESGEKGMPKWPYRFGYALPAGCLRVVRIETGLPTGSLATHAARPVPFTVARYLERLILLCDRESITLAYLADIENSGLLPPKLRDTLIYQLASKLALHLGERRTLMEGYDAKAQQTFQEAMLVDAREGYDVIPRDDTWLRERNGFYGFRHEEGKY